MRLQGVSSTDRRRGAIAPANTIFSLSITVIAASQWQSVDDVMMLFIVAIRGIPRHPDEAAELDGAGPVAPFRHITVPQLRDMPIVAKVVTVTGAITVFAEPRILTGGGPGHASTTLATDMYRAAFFRDEMGYAAAIASVVFVAHDRVAGPVAHLRQGEVTPMQALIRLPARLPVIPLSARC